MSVPVALDALREQVDSFGPHPHLVTVGADGRAHVVSVSVELDGGELRLGAGRTSRANLGVHAAVVLLWAAPPGGDYSLIVDGEGAVGDPDEPVVIRPTRAVLHRVAAASAELPSCVPLED